MGKKTFFTSLLVGMFLTLSLFLPQLTALMVKLELAELVESANKIIIGEVKEMSCRWNEDKSLIFTDVVVEVKEIIKGENLPEEVVVTYTGGEIGDLGLKVSDMPEFEIGEEVLVFLEGADEVKRAVEKAVSNFQVVGQFQGKYTVLKDEVTGEKKVISREKILARETALKKGKIEIYVEEGEEILLSDFIKEIKRLMKQGGK